MKADKNFVLREQMATYSLDDLCDVLNRAVRGGASNSQAAHQRVLALREFMGREGRFSREDAFAFLATLMLRDETVSFLLLAADELVRRNGGWSAPPGDHIRLAIRIPGMDDISKAQARLLAVQKINENRCAPKSPMPLFDTV